MEPRPSHAAPPPTRYSSRRHTDEWLRHLHAATTRSRRWQILGQLLRRIGEDSLVELPFACWNGENITLGEHVRVGPDCYLADAGPIRIENRAVLGPRVQIYTSFQYPHEVDNGSGEWPAAVHIGFRAVIGGGSIIGPGVSVGRGAVVGIGSVVTTDVPPGAVVSGNPARVLSE